MANMSYCRFRNTELDLNDCVDAFDELNGTVGNEEENDESLSRLEFQAMKSMIRTAEEFISRAKSFVKDAEVA